MNEDKYKFRLGRKKQRNNNEHGNIWFSYFVKPSKRYFNKKVRKGLKHKRGIGSNGAK